MRGFASKELRVVLLVAAVVPGLVLAAPLELAEAKKKSDVTRAVIENLDMEFAEQIIRDLQNMGTSDLGFRGAGSASSREASLYVRDLMENRIGLAAVALEEIPLDAWEFREAWLEVPGLGRIQAASFAGSPGTDGEITAEMVNVGNGFALDYEGKSVEGKIVLANWVGNDFWTDSMAMEAYIHGAVAIVLTTYASDYGNTPGALQTHDGLYRPYWPPMISISGEDGLRIIGLLESGEPLVVTAYSDIWTLSMEDGGFGWNVVGYLPGKRYGQPDDEFLILGDHTDAWFYGGMDDNSGVAATLVLADAIKRAYESLDMKPDRTFIFTTHEAEEYGIQDAYFDWCYGAWYQITYHHPDWVGRSVAYMNFELMGMEGMPLRINMAPELVSFVHKVLGQNKGKLPYGFRVTPFPNTWADHWTFSAAGIPGMNLATSNLYWTQHYYHSQFDTVDLISFVYLRQLFEVFADMAIRLVELPIIPYNFETTATNLWEKLTYDDDFGVHLLYPVYDKYGLDSETNMGRLLAAAAAFREKAATLNMKLKMANPSMANEINAQLMAIEAFLGQTLIAMGVWEQDWYPYQQSANDVVHMDAGIDILLRAVLTDDDVTDAIWELNWVGIIWYYDYMSYENYLDQYSRLCGEEVVSWGLQTHLLPCVEIWEEYNSLSQLAYWEDVTAEDISPIVASLQTKLLDQALANLEESFRTMWMGLEDANSRLDALIADL